MKKMDKLLAMLLVGVVGLMGMSTVYADDPTPSGGSGNTTTTTTPGTDSSSSSSTTDASAGTVGVDCTNTKLVVGASTTCTVYIKPTAALVASTGTKSVTIYASQSKYLTMSDIKTNTGFTLLTSDITDKTLARNTITLTYSGTDLKEGEKKEILSFTLKLEEEAANLKDGNCGDLCITGVMFDSNTAKVGDDGKACPNIIITKQACEGKDCNPETGAFMNYAVIAGVSAVALVAIAVVTKKKKFYTV